MKGTSVKTKEELQETAQLVRIHEANCSLLFPTREEGGFRLAIMKKLAQELELKELRSSTLAEDAPSAQRSSRT